MHEINDDIVLHLNLNLRLKDEATWYPAEILLKQNVKGIELRFTIVTRRWYSRFVFPFIQMNEFDCLPTGSEHSSHILFAQALIYTSY